MCSSRVKKNKFLMNRIALVKTSFIISSCFSLSKLCGHDMDISLSVLKHQTWPRHVVLSQIPQEFAFILIHIYQHKCLLLSKGMSGFKSDYTTMKSSMCRFQKCKKKYYLEKLLLVARFFIRGHHYQTTHVVR